MSSITDMTKKELKELLTPATVLPVVMMAVIFALIGTAIGGAMESLEEKPTIAVIDLDSGQLSEVAYDTLDSISDIVYNGTDVQEALSVLENENGTALLVLTANFTEDILGNTSGTIKIYWIMEGAGLISSFSSGAVNSLIGVVDDRISMTLIEDGLSDNASVILDPTRITSTTVFKGTEIPNISPDIISGLLSQQSLVVPLVVVMIIIMSGSTVITSMGIEKENKTLETLLTLPVKRSSIVLSKLLGATAVGLIMAIIYMIGFGYYMGSFQASGNIDFAEFGLTLSPTDYILIGVSLFLALISGLALCLILGIFTKNFKAAQSMTAPVVFLALIPMFVLMMMDFDTLPLPVQIFVFAVPFSHPMIAMSSLMFGNTTFVLLGIVYEAVFALVMMFIAVSLFKRDILLVGRVKKESGEDWKSSKYPLIALMKSVVRKRRKKGS